MTNMRNTITMIDAYDKLPVGDYVKIAEVAGRPYDEEIDRQMEIISILAGISVEEVGDISIVEYPEYVLGTSFLEQPCPKVELKDSYTIGGYELVPLKDYRNMTTSQYVDFQTFAKRGQSAFVEELSCLLIPKGCSYNKGYDIVALQQALRTEMMTPDAMALLTFFFDSWLTLIADSLASLASAAKTARAEEAKVMLTTVKLLKEDVLRIVGDGFLV